MNGTIYGGAGNDTITISGGRVLGGIDGGIDSDGNDSDSVVLTSLSTLDTRTLFSGVEILDLDEDLILSGRQILVRTSLVLNISLVLMINY